MDECGLGMSIETVCQAQAGSVHTWVSNAEAKPLSEFRARESKPQEGENKVLGPRTWSVHI